MADAFITIQLEGIPEDGGDVRLGEFIEELGAIRTALRLTERLLIQSDTQSVDYKIVNLSHSSPAKVTIGITSREPVYRDTPRKISRRFTSALQMVRRGHRYASRLDPRTLEAFQSITAPTKKHVSQITVTGERNQSVRIDQQFERSLARLLEGDESERDEIIGRVERVDIHNKNQFDIYPVIGSSRIRCSAPNRLQKEIRAAIGRTVAVDGWALYRKDSPFPYAMKVEDIGPPLEEDEDLPKMEDLRGIAPDATDGKKPEDFIRELRDASW
jgi:hypothetical protein